VQRLYEPWPEHVGGFKGKFEDIVFGSAFDAGPHGPTALCAVGPGSGDVDKRHGRVKPRQCSGGGEGEVVRDLCVLGLGHASRCDAEAEKAGIEIREFGFDGRVVQKIGVNELSEFGVLLTRWSADDGEDLFHVGIENAFAKNALTDHPGCSKKNHIHLLASVRT